MPIGPVEPSVISLVQPGRALEGPAAFRNPGSLKEASAFTEMFEGIVGHANATANMANAQAADLAAGRIDDIHGTMIEVQKAGIEMKLVGNIRNKVVDAFYELWRMSV